MHGLSKLEQNLVEVTTGPLPPFSLVWLPRCGFTEPAARPCRSITAGAMSLMWPLLPFNWVAQVTLAVAATQTRRGDTRPSLRSGRMAGTGPFAPLARSERVGGSMLHYGSTRRVATTRASAQATSAGRFAGRFLRQKSSFASAFLLPTATPAACIGFTVHMAP